MEDGALRRCVLLVRVSREDSDLLGETFAHEECTQVDVVSFHFVVGSYEPGGCHGVGDRLVVHKCRLHSTQVPLSIVSGVDLGLEQLSQLNYIIDTYLFVAALLWRPTLSSGGRVFSA